ncbi:MAG: hypothetical protein OSJ63_03950 [Bacilli bacterium]|nr:hypothetical protein [Bacilli bacterium]
MAVTKEPIKVYRIIGNEMVDLKTMGWNYQITYIKHRNTKQNILRIDKDHYKNLNTGEIKKVKHKKNRADSKKTAKQSMKKLRELINTNIVEVEKALWVTLTYKENMTDPKQLYKDFDKFMKRLRYNYQDYNIEYINVCEPQGRGAWHCHVILIFDKQAPFIANDKMSEIWGHGFTKTTMIFDIDNVGAYLTSYLSDMKLEEVEENNIEYEFDDIKEVLIDNQKKKVVKNSRLSLYPQGFRFYRKSKGIKNPIVERMSYASAKRKIGLPYPTFFSGVKIVDKKNGFSNIIYREHYNMKADYLIKIQRDGTYVSVFNKWKPQENFLYF